MRLAFYTYSYTDRLNMPIEPVLERIAAAGYGGIDVSGTHGPSADPNSVTQAIRHQTKETTDRLGLRIEAVITHETLTDSLLSGHPLKLQGSVDLAADLGAPVVVFHMGGPREGADGHPEMWRRVVDYLKKALDDAHRRNVKLAVDGIWYGWIAETPEAFLKLHDDIGSDSFGINYDPCYLTLLGLDPVKVAHLWKGRILHAHLKDHVGVYPNWEARIPGQGTMDYARVVGGLHEIGFNEAISIETFTDMDFEASCTIGFQTLSPAVSA